jgi:DNA-binding transcriptional regulator YhcF (GntR family)
MDITIDHTAATAPYEQLRLRIAELAANGTLTAGARLPPVRALAVDLGLAANTVARAYRELELAGVIETRGRSGSFVALSSDSAERALQEAAAAYATRASSLGIDARRARAYIDAALNG